VRSGRRGSGETAERTKGGTQEGGWGSYEAVEHPLVDSNNSRRELESEDEGRTERKHVKVEWREGESTSRQGVFFSLSLPFLVDGLPLKHGSMGRAERTKTNEVCNFSPSPVRPFCPFQQATPGSTARDVHCRTPEIVSDERRVLLSGGGSSQGIRPVLERRKAVDSDLWSRRTAQRRC
jgi:hypothetical protein